MQSAELSQSRPPADALVEPPDDSLDITTETCPMTYVRTRLRLDRMQSGQILEIRLQGADAVRNVPRTAIEQGHSVVSQKTDASGITVLSLRKV